MTPPRTTCRSCGEPVFWARTSAGKSMPVDAEPVEGGNLALTTRYDAQGTRFVEYVDPAQATLDAEPRYVSHFATCPDSDRWRT